MVDRIVIADYSKDRRDHLVGSLRERLSKVEVHEMVTEPPEPVRDTDNAKLKQLSANRYDLLIAHIGGNPSGYDCLKAFKAHNPKGKVILYTKMDAIPVSKFEGLKLANAIIRRAQDDSRVFANEDEMLDVVNRVRKESGLIHWVSPFKDPKVRGALLTLITAIVTSVTKWMLG